MMKHSLLIQFIRPALLLICTTLVVTSCTKSSDSAGSQGIIQVSIADATFESEETLGNRAATSAESSIQRNTIELNKDFLMVAELRPEDPASTSLKNGTTAALDTSALANNIRYRVLVYNQAGAFVTERDYIRGQESSTAALALDGGSTYTFVVVSFNQTTDLPATTPAVATRTLANSQISTTTGITALMYYQQTLTVTGNSVNRLDIVLKHRKPLIGVTINASQTGYNITAVSGNFRPHNNGMTVNLANGTHIQSGTEQPVAVNFNIVGSGIVVNTSVNYINSISNNVTIFTITSMTIGSITATNLTPFTNLTVTPGVRYNLILNIVPTDEFITHQGRPAARINGVIWALHNLGVATTVDAEQTPITSSLHGNFYQFGRTVSVANGTATSTNSNWIQNPQNRGAWNLVDAAPVKTALDPCPTGYRVPSSAEAQDLIDNTVHSTKGNMTISQTNFNAASVLTSKRSSSVRLIFPHQGDFGVSGSALTNYVPTSSRNRGTIGLIHTSRTNQNVIWRLRPSATGTTVFQTADNLSNYSISMPIRCVGI